MKNILYYVSLITLISAFCLIAYVGYQILYPFKIVELKKFNIVEESVHSGENINVELEFIKNHDFKPDVKYYLVDGYAIELNRAAYNRPKGETKTLLIFQIPPEAKKGTYHLQIDISYRINSFRTITYTWVSDDFKITGKEGELR